MDVNWIQPFLHLQVICRFLKEYHECRGCWQLIRK
jgi:hypothetical protein